MGEGVTEQAFFDEWLRQGYAVVATDYQGLGEAGQVLFMHARSEGMNVLDSVRAARSRFSELSDSVLLYGHSQGGQAVLAAAALAPTYAPGIKVLGVMAAAPPLLDEQGLKERLAASGFSAASTLPVMMSLAQSAGDAGQDMKGVFTERGKAFGFKARNECIEDFAPAVHKAGLTPNTAFTPVAAQKFAALARGWTAYPSASIKVPVLIGTGMNDHHNAPAEQDRLVGSLCQAGSTVQHVRLNGINHFGTLHGMQRNAESFAADVRAGRMPTSVCSTQ
ncbi:secretory lipase family protein [Neokomagataea thailandica NBRC 106555]|nr:secretory lipase family protein [Neokomagataea thailandica NBRC 106555]